MEGVPGMSLYIFLFAVISDRLTKYWALAAIPSMRSQDAPSWLVLFFNKGISFSMFHSNSHLGALLSAAGLLCLAIIYFKKYRISTSKGIVFLLGGALSNFCDRIFYGHVIDWLYIGLHFNLADIWICIGGVLLLKDCTVNLRKDL